MVAVIKKFHGRSVPKPSMKKISHTPLFLLDDRVEETRVTDVICNLTKNTILCRPTEIIKVEW